MSNLNDIFFTPAANQELTYDQVLEDVQRYFAENHASTIAEAGEGNAERATSLLKELMEHYIVKRKYALDGLSTKELCSKLYEDMAGYSFLKKWIYIVKPFDLDELGARIAAHLRREQRRQNNSAVRFFGELILDYSARTVTINNQNIPLSKREFEIVELLSLNAGQVFDRERIYERVWGLDGDGNSDTIMEHIRKIRAKFAAHTLHNYIETVWGCGYRWNA